VPGAAPPQNCLPHSLGRGESTSPSLGGQERQRGKRRATGRLFVKIAPCPRRHPVSAVYTLAGSNTAPSQKRSGPIGIGACVAGGNESTVFAFALAVGRRIVADPLPHSEASFGSERGTSPISEGAEGEVCGRVNAPIRGRLTLRSREFEQRLKA
jgi:hypothetical protein